MSHKSHKIFTIMQRSGFIWLLILLIIVSTHSLIVIIITWIALYWCYRCYDYDHKEMALQTYVSEFNEVEFEQLIMDNLDTILEILKKNRGLEYSKPEIELPLILREFELEITDGE